MRAYERMLDYVSVWTTSDENSDTVPSAEREFDLARQLVRELKEIGLTDAEMDDQCYVYASLPATPGYEEKPALGFVAHVDTAIDFSGKDIKPQMIENYDGKDVVLGTSGRTIKVSEFPHLSSLKGRTLITTDGTTLLGADDKAGIAEIMTALDEIIKEGTPHGKICIGFTPDEEIARSANHFNVEKLGATYAYTMDGGQEGQIQFENFNASTVEVTIHGVNVHTGSALGILVNAQLLAMELNALLPEDERPETTEGYEGFYHLVNMSGNVEEVHMKYAIRDHDPVKYQEREAYFQSLEKKMNEKYGEGTVEVKIIESYRNMKEMILPCFHLVDYAKMAIEAEGVPVDVTPVRGGTDGARLSFKGLPCPNLGTGGYAYHGPLEHITVEGMDISVRIMKRIITMYAEQ